MDKDRLDWAEAHLIGLYVAYVDKHGAPNDVNVLPEWEGEANVTDAYGASLRLALRLGKEIKERKDKA